MVMGEEGSADKGKLRLIKKAVYQEKFVSGIRLATKRLAFDRAQAGAMSEPWRGKSHGGGDRQPPAEGSEMPVTVIFSPDPKDSTA
jgi:hypothetical protein